jgi:hypothetical protein
MSATASGQNINIDYGKVFAAPSNAYAGAAGQAGAWNLLFNTPGALPLMDIDGNATSATISDVTGGNLDFSFNNAGTVGDDQALLDDLIDLGGAGQADTFMVDGLEPASYDVYTYAWAPDNSTFITSVNVNAAGAQNVGGVWPGSLMQGVTHAFHAVDAPNGTLTINFTTVSGFSSFNGLQIVQGDGKVPCVGDCDGNGVANILDFVCFQQEWAAQTDLGDCDGNGTYNILDFVCFQQEWQKFAGGGCN